MSGPARQRRTSRQRLFSAAAIALCAIAIIAVIGALRGSGEKIGERLREADLAWLLVSGVFGSVGMGWIAACWWRLMNRWPPALSPESPAAGALATESPSADSFGGQSSEPIATSTVSFAKSFAWYFAGEIGKYIPGGIWPVIGRGELARRGGVDTRRAYNSVVWSLLFLMGAGLASAAAAFPIVSTVGRPWSYVGLVVPFLALAALQDRPMNTLSASLRGVSKRIDFGTATERLLGFVSPLGAWVFIGLAYASVAKALHLHFSFGAVCVAAIAAWVAGTLAVGVPGGAGVREAVFMAMASMPKGEAALIAIAGRFVFVLIDLLGFAVASVVLYRQRERRPQSTMPPSTTSV